MCTYNASRDIYFGFCCDTEGKKKLTSQQVNVKFIYCSQFCFSEYLELESSGVAKRIFGNQRLFKFLSLGIPGVLLVKRDPNFDSMEKD